MNFTFKQVYDTLSKAQFGQVYYIDRTKNEKGFWDWTKASTTNETTEDIPMAAQPVANAVKTPTVSPKSTYETSEERAARQQDEIAALDAVGDYVCVCVYLLYVFVRTCIFSICIF